MGRIVRFPTDEGEVVAYLARAASGFGAGVVVLDVGWCEADVSHDLCDGLAGYGFSALAPDLHGEDGRPLSDDAALAAVREGLAYLSFHPSVRDAGVGGVVAIGVIPWAEGLSVRVVRWSGDVDAVVGELRGAAG